jgi:glucose/arabinose dehydrogenase
MMAFVVHALCDRAAFGQAIQPGTIPVAIRNVATVTPGATGAPTFGVNSGDPRFLYVGEQGGRIRTLDFNQPSPLLATDFLNVPAALSQLTSQSLTIGNEKGLLGAAFHPDFNNPANPNGYRKFYTYTSELLDLFGRVPTPTPHLFHQSETPFAPSNTQYDHQSVIREWTVDLPDANGVATVDTGNMMNPSRHRVVMRIGQPGQFHNGGALAFGPDGYLYISLGDGGAGGQNGANDGGNNFTANQGHTNPGNPDTTGGWTGQGNAQDRRNVYGSILRIKPTSDADAATNANTVDAGYRIPKSNPFTADTNAQTPVSGWQDNWADEIYAYGFRNPFRINFDRATGELYAADVGQDRNTISREEVSRIVSGGNFGWVIKSGTEINDRPPGNPTSAFSPNIGVPLIDPIAQYPTTQMGQGGLAVIGGFVYRGTAIPGLAGKYVFGDLNRGDGSGGRMLYSDFSDAALNVFDLSIVGPTPKPSGVLIHGVAEDARGELYYLMENGQVLKLVPIPEPLSSWLALAGAVLSGLFARFRPARTQN